MIKSWLRRLFGKTYTTDIQPVVKFEGEYYCIYVDGNNLVMRSSKDMRTWSPQTIIKIGHV